MNFKEKYGNYALVAGGTSGIGLALAEGLAERGLNIILVARKLEELTAAQQSLKINYSVDVIILQADLSSTVGLEKIKADTEKLEVGLYVNAAGLEVNGAFEKNSIEKELMVVQLNVISLLSLTHHFVQKMISRKKGGLLFVASLSGHMPNPYFANYAGTKAYVLNFGASLFGELKPKGIDVTVLSPGLTNTPMTANNGVDFSKTPMAAMEPKEVAEIGINAIGKKFLAIPGFKNSMMALMAKHSPLEMQAKMNEKMMYKAIDKTKI
jgi:hypothetical protein